MVRGRLRGGGSPPRPALAVGGRGFVQSWRIHSEILTGIYSRERECRYSVLIIGVETTMPGQFTNSCSWAVWRRERNV